VRDPVISALRRRITATVDSSQSEDSAEVTLTLRGGRSYTETVVHATGAPENPMTDDQLEIKFRSLVGDALPKERVEELLGRLWEMDQQPDVAKVVALTRMDRREVRR
jgi:2-methylcitrate dehydratase